MISAIVAVDENWGIGYQGQLLERIPADLKHFKQLTENNIVVMGRKTWESLPNKSVLPRLSNRINVIVSNSMLKDIDEEVLGHLTLVMTLEKAIDYIQDKNIFVIGGGQIYNALLPYCDRVYVTKIYASHDNIDTFFPNLDESREWNAIEEDSMASYNDIKYQFWRYDRVS